MRFKDFVFKKRPTKISIRHREKIQEDMLSNGELSLKNTGETTVIQCEGVFVGESSRDDFKALSSLVGQEGRLTLPYIEPVFGVISEVVLTSCTEVERVGYGFTFTEIKPLKREVIQHGEVIADEGDSIFEIAHRAHEKVERITELNGQIDWVTYLSAGERVRI